MSRCGTDQPPLLGVGAFEAVRSAARDIAPVSGLTHRFYKYPARFSPTFAGTAIDHFSRPGDLVLDPYMGGGTTVLEALRLGRYAVGNDINSLAVFLARVKTTPLNLAECEAIKAWAATVVPTLSYWDSTVDVGLIGADRRTFNLTIPRARPLKKLIALALQKLSELSTQATRELARCALLNVGQLFLDGRRRTFSLSRFRAKLHETICQMADASHDLSTVLPHDVRPTLINGSAADLSTTSAFENARKAALVVTSPPYPGIHILYHRWQVDGRRESPAPYWLANCQDGQGNAYYNFAGRESADHRYFAESLRTLNGIRAVMKSGGIIVQLIAFSEPKRHLRRYLQNMEAASFEEMRMDGRQRIWRDVPSRKWHANMKGKSHGAREVVLIHRAV